MIKISKNLKIHKIPLNLKNDQKKNTEISLKPIKLPKYLLNLIND